MNKLELSVNELLEENEFEGLDKSKLVFQDFDLYDRPTFVDYLKADWKIQMVGAIDFTSANGKLNEETCLHTLEESNRYETTLQSLESILGPYSSTKSYTFFGFGGDTKMEESTTQMNPYIDNDIAIDEVNYSFPINGDAQ